jgi:hypothetical protein
MFRLVGGNGLLCAMAQLVEQLPPLWAPYWASNEHLKDKGVLALLFYGRDSFILSSRCIGCKSA